MTKAVFKTTATKVVPQKILEATGRSPTLRIYLITATMPFIKKTNNGPARGLSG